MEISFTKEKSFSMNPLRRGMSIPMPNPSNPAARMDSAIGMSKYAGLIPIFLRSAKVFPIVEVSLSNMGVKTVREACARNKRMEGFFSVAP